jgi:hypothetical protein
MKLSALMVINAVVSAVFGVGLVLVPGTVLSQYGATTDAAFEYTGQLLGAALIAFAVITWLARKATDSEARRAILLGIFVGDLAGFILALKAQLGGVVNSVGWSTVVIYLVLALGFGYFAFAKPAAA